VNGRLPLPVLVTEIGWAGGAAPPCVALKPSAAGATASAGGGGAVSVSVTGIARVPALPLLTVTLAVCVPGCRPLVLTATARSRGALPLVGVTVSHDASSDALKVNVPPPVFVTASVLPAGLPAPASPANDNAAGATARTGGAGAVTVSVTGMVLGEPAAPAAVTVTAPL
jgi:hypothetical protein